MEPAEYILIAISAVLGVWCVSLLWRIVLAHIAWDVKQGGPPARSSRMIARLPTKGQRIAGVAFCFLGIFGAAIAMISALSLHDVIDRGLEFITWDLIAKALSADVGLVAVGGIITGWWLDPAKGRKRCPRCWYSMENAVSARCPECGRDSKGDRDLLRTRRSSRMVAASLLMLIAAYGVRVAPAVKRYGWIGAVPLTAKVVVWPWLPERAMTGVFGFEERELSGWQVELLHWQARRTLQTTTSPLTASLAVRAMSVRSTTPWNTPDSYPTNAALARIMCESLVANDKRAMQIERIFWGDALLLVPQRLDKDTASALMPSIARALNTGASREASYAMMLLGRSGTVGEPQLAQLESLAHDLSLGDRFLRGASYAVAAMAGESDAARATLFRLLSDPNPLIQQAAADASWMARPGTPELIDRLGQLTESTDVQLAVAAGMSLLRLDPTRCPRMEKVIDLIERLPNPQMGEFILRAAAETEDPRFTDHVRYMLSDIDPAHVISALPAVQIMSTPTAVAKEVKALIEKYDDTTPIGMMARHAQPWANGAVVNPRPRPR